MEPSVAQRIYSSPVKRQKLMVKIAKLLNRGQLKDAPSVHALSVLFTLTPCVDGMMAEDASIWFARSFVTDPKVFIDALQGVEIAMRAENLPGLKSCGFGERSPSANGSEFIIVDRVFDLMAMELRGSRPPKEFAAKLSAAKQTLRGASVVRFFSRLDQFD